MGCGTWGCGDVGTQGRGDSGTWGRGDSGTSGLGDVRGLEDVGRRDLRTNGFSEVNISVKISKDTAQVFKD